MMHNNNATAAQYEFARKLLQCGHGYVTLDGYKAAFNEAMTNTQSAQSDLEQDGWYKVCVIVNELGSLLFGQEWEIERSKIVLAYAKEA